MSDLRAEPLSPIDAATLWPQLRRLSTEVVATRAGENLLVSSGLAATGLSNLPRVPRTIVLGVKRGLSYRGVLVGRELDGGAGWEAVSVRIAREKDDDAVAALLGSAGLESARRGGRALFMRSPEGSPHATGIRRGGLMAYRSERLFAIRGQGLGTERFRLAGRGDRHGVFRLYCRVVPEHVRRQEAATQTEWRAVLGSFDCEKEHVAEGERGVIAWAGFGERECRVMVDAVEGLADAALDCVEAHAPRHGVLVLSEEQSAIEERAVDRGYVPLGVRLVCARRLAALNDLKEVVAAPADLAMPQST
jgi:hypothetical protein